MRVRSHDFPEKDTVTISPCGVYDIAASRGFVPAGTGHDTAAFAVNAIGLWWREEGQFRYPGAGRLLVTIDSGGSGSARCRLWKDQLAVLAAGTGLVIGVCHFPPGTPERNKTGHRLFCRITRTWRARPLMTVDDAVAGIAATVTAGGLKCTAVTDDGHCPAGTEVSGTRMRYLQDRVIERDAFHGERNYALLPVPRPAPEPEPAPGPSRPGHVLALRLRTRLNLPVQAIGALPGVSHSTVSSALTLTSELLASTGTPLPPAAPPPGIIPGTPAGLIAHAAAAGITLTIPENSQTMPEHFKSYKSRTTMTRPKQPTKLPTRPQRR